MKTDCMVRLHCIINEWFYSNDVSIDLKADGVTPSCEKMLSLSGEVTCSGFINPMLFDIKLLCLKKFSVQDELCMLEFINSLDEYGIPEHLWVLIPSTDEQFADLKNDFFRSSLCPSMEVRLTLDVEGLEKDRSGDNKITPVSNSSMRVVSYNFQFLNSIQEGN